MSFHDIFTQDFVFGEGGGVAKPEEVQDGEWKYWEI